MKLQKNSPMSVQNTPAIGFGTPAILQGAPPWAVQTPEVSPMLWQRAPNPNGNIGNEVPGNLAGGLSKELLRRVCEPFFEQMLVALQDVLANTSPYQADADPNYDFIHNHGGYGVDQLSEEDMCEGGDLGAFSSVLLVDTPWPGGALQVIGAPPGDLSSHTTAPKKPDDEKAPTAMVCRHWKSKGWCRLGDACKFSHPDHKCGVGGAANAGKGHSAGSGAPLGHPDQGVSFGRGGAPNVNSSGDEGGAADGTKKAGRRRRKARGAGGPPQQGDDGRNMADHPFLLADALQHSDFPSFQR